MNAPAQAHVARCPYCRVPLFQRLEAYRPRGCLSCKRPIIVARNPLARRGGWRIYSLFDLGLSAYGFATIAIVLAFALGAWTALGFVKAFVIALFLVGSILCADGSLALLASVDRTFGTVRRGLPARLIGSGKVAAGLVALFLVAVGLMV